MKNWGSPRGSPWLSTRRSRGRNNEETCNNPLITWYGKLRHFFFHSCKYFFFTKNCFQLACYPLFHLNILSEQYVNLYILQGIKTAIKNNSTNSNSTRQIHFYNNTIKIIKNLKTLIDTHLNFYTFDYSLNTIN